MKRLFNLVEHCIRHSEPILLVGDTGCGKTTVCQMLALFLRQKLHILNCHQHSETADFIGVRSTKMLSSLLCFSFPFPSRCSEAVRYNRKMISSSHILMLVNCQTGTLIMNMFVYTTYVLLMTGFTSRA